MSIQTKVRLGFAGAFLLLIAVGYITQRHLQNCMENAAWVYHTVRVLEQIDTIDVALRTAESEQRGFLLTGNKALQEKFRQAHQQAATRLISLRTLTADNPRQQQLLNRLEPLLGQMFMSEASAIELQKSSAESATAGYALASIGNQQAAQQIRSLLQQLDNEEDRLLIRRSNDFRNSSAVVRTEVAAGSVLRVLAALLCLVLITRYLRRREEAEATLLQVKRGLEERVQERTSELTRLTASLRAEITERRNAEEQLRESEQRYRFLAKASNGAIWDWDVASGLLQWSEAPKSNFGYADETISFDGAMERVHPGERERVVAGLNALFDQDEEHWSDEYRHRRADGSYADVLGRVYVIRDSERKPVRLIGSILDLSEHRLAERALHDSEKRYRMLFEDSPLPMMVYEIETLAILAVNAAAGELFEYTRAECLTMSLRDLKPAEDLPGFVDRMRATAATGAYKALNTVERKGGQKIIIEANGREIRFGDRQAILSLLTEVTEQKRLEAQLRQSQKTEAVGRLAGGIAHDFNNLLTVILGYSDGLLRKLDANDPLRRKVAEIQAAGQRAANLTSQLLAFSRKQILQVQILDLNTIVSSINQMVGRLLGEDIQISLHLAPELGQIQADPTQLEQVLVNLAVNARDAMPEGGQLTIETQSVDISHECASIRGIPPGQYALLTVSDTGCGMNEAIKAQVFEPFFTTKEVGKGTGLGLSMVWGFVQQSGGTVTVHSEPGAGSTFRIYLPLLQAPAAQPESTDRLEALPSGKGAAILLVEDEDRVRGLAYEVLHEAGYSVIEARNGREALELTNSSQRAPSLVLTDLVMPEMSGPELAEQLWKKWPGLPIVFTSGYTDHALLRPGNMRQNTPFLQKPYTPASLLDQTASTLERSSRPAVLIVDDEVNIRRLLRGIFEEAGYAVIEAPNGRDALARMADQTVKLVVTDLVMPEQEGIETIQTLKQRYPWVKILAVSGAFGGSFLKMASQLGADWVLPKPLRREQVLQAAEKALE